MKKRYVVGGLTAVALVTLSGAGVTYAHVGNSDREEGRRGGYHGELVADLLGITTDEFRERVANGEKPKEIMEAAGITKEDIKAARQAHKIDRLTIAVANGHITQAQADTKIAQMEAQRANHQAAQTALANNDYAAWSSAVAGKSIADKITATNFGQLVSAHKLLEAGDHEGAKAIFESLGIDHRGGHGKGREAMGYRGHHSQE